MSNYKNRLQEYCQKHRIALPVYNSYLLQNNEGGFKCNASIIYEDGRIRGESGIFPTKKESEKDAAKHILNLLEEHKNRKIQIISSQTPKSKKHDFHVVVYLDMENINVKKLKEMFEVCKYDKSQYMFIGCMSTGHHHAQTEFTFEGISFKKVLVPSTRKDATDIGMIMHAMSHYSGKVDNMVFVSNDRFSCVFSELGSKGFCVDSTKTYVHHSSNIIEMKDLLIKL